MICRLESRFASVLVYSAMPQLTSDLPVLVINHLSNQQACTLPRCLYYWVSQNLRLWLRSRHFMTDILTVNLLVYAVNRKFVTLPFEHNAWTWQKTDRLTDHGTVTSIAIGEIACRLNVDLVLSVNTCTIQKLAGREVGTSSLISSRHWCACSAV